MKLDRVLGTLVFLMITLGVYYIFADFALLKLNTADASTYLNIAENIVSHKGFVVSYNLYQFFTAHYYPIWPYMQSIYPLLCSIVFMFHGGIEQVIRLNIFILGLNTALIFYIIQTVVPSRLNVLFLVCMVFSFNFYISAFYAWTEQFHLLLFFIIFLKYSDRPRGLAAVGLLNGILFLVRVAQIYNIMAYLLVILIAEVNIRQRTKNVLIFMGGFLAIVGPYQLFNLAVYHAFYPQYIKPAADYTMARISKLSTYKPGYPGLYNPVGFGGNREYFYQHLSDFFVRINLFLIPVLAYVSVPKPKNKGQFFILNCMLQSLFIILGYCYSFNWNSTIDSLRYSLIPFVLIFLAGWFCFYELFFASEIKWKKLLLVFLLFSFSFYSVDRYLYTRQGFMSQPRTKIPYYIDLFEVYRWIDKNLPENILVASNEDQEPYFMHRPFISTPPYKSYNCNNLKIFNRMYSPDYFLLSSSLSDACFSQIPSVKIFSNKTFRLLEVKKKKK